MQRAAGAVPVHPGDPSQGGLLRLLARIRFQLLGGLLIAVLVPALLRGQFELRLAPGSLENTVLGTTIALVLGAYAIRRLLPLPGVQATSFVIPALTATYAGVAIAFLLLRADYSRFLLLASFLLAVPWFLFVTVVERRFKRPRLALLPVGRTRSLAGLKQADWTILEDPKNVPRSVSGIVADLRVDLPARWERLLARCALEGLPIYHSKHVVESLTGRVEIEHLSENSLGSVLPSSVYRKVKRFTDTLAVLLALPLILVIGSAAALLIRLEDGGPIFFKQARMGHCRRVFTMFKFRTMRVDAPEGNHFTEENDPRITRIGGVLRRYRIDELPQVINILRGEMSVIGPRPESLPLSQRYEKKIPFYVYRHIVRPGITGWAQVQQGWAAEVEDVVGKLHYDFFYIKHFSPWLDILIAARTIRTILTGFGAR